MNVVVVITVVIIVIVIIVIVVVFLIVRCRFWSVGLSARLPRAEIRCFGAGRAPAKLRRQKTGKAAPRSLARALAGAIFANSLNSLKSEFLSAKIDRKRRKVGTREPQEKLKTPAAATATTSTTAAAAAVLFRHHHCHHHH